MLYAIWKTISQRLYLLWSAVFFGLSIFLGVALISYKYTDPSFNRVSNNIVENLAGKYGAFYADPLLQLFGLSTALLVLIPLSWSVNYFLDKSIKFFWLRVITLVSSITLISGLMTKVTAPESWMFTSLGGFVGNLVNSKLSNYISVEVYLYALAVSSLISLYIALSIPRDRWVSIFNSCKAAFVYAGHFILFLCKILILPFRYIYRKLCKSENIIEEEQNWIGSIKPKPANKRAVKKRFSIKRTSLFKTPPLELLKEATDKVGKYRLSATTLQNNACELMQVLGDFGVKGEIKGASQGPVVTLYELEPAAGTKSSRVIGLSDDISRSMQSLSARIAVIAGRNAIGVELPNKHRETVYLKELIESSEYKNCDFALPLVLGKDISGAPVIADLARMPHLLVAGTTGSGKSVAINTMILSLLYKHTPEECKFIMIDPKMLELSAYDDIPHLLTPVVTEPGKAIVALKWVVKEMENRYRLMSNLGVRNIAGYNERIEEAKSSAEVLEKKVQTGFDPETGAPIIESIPIEKEALPFIVVIVDEMADLMLVGGKDIETSIQRLSQMARAAGIHIIMATQRPSVDVITGVIKANFPTRISFQVTSRIDSRTILGEQGAEQLLGMGDMLYMAGGGRITRVHGAFVSDREVEKVSDFLKSQGEPEYMEEVTTSEDEEFSISALDGGDDLYRQAVEIVLRDKKASTSYIQRCLKIGYNRAATIIEQMEKQGVVSPANHVGKREILLSD